MAKRKGKMTRSAKWVLATLRDHGYEVTGPLFIRRTYAGYWQQSAGAWSWTANDTRGASVAASQYSIKELIKSPEVEIGRELNGFVLVIDPK